MHLPDAEALCAALADAMRAHVDPARTALVGIHTGGVWVAERLHAALGLNIPSGSIDVSFYRDDYNQRGLHANAKTSQIPFDVEGAHIVIVDDVLYTGRTIRAAMNELFDYGRPAKIDLAVLTDRGGRELPIAPTFCPHSLNLPVAQMLALERVEGGKLSFRLMEK
ncbi:bifunctional pyr operon transcriptional regulator/uracil phosphoribosyltransferase PyrR [Sulfuritalea hydrogenivorans]|jgi:pyrimidine operon attenuation protein/uracil phosphoribosyltransferase|uniref:Bifunctional pyrimidine regulatory protein PyrR/uracil phosphoribosyltransferase n=1 Tax=Sulfuritalea hydrogenivorans sk43H TaxID=1223802 RepID=W0SBE4_9PROT|nr:bifunctional pyr operon transcriptional regulator/uracil phosphoribosyltransferase PyrR [Sulfuritalea hydrogenivorans]BAO28075.1 bifunctional pyrimidine regulatory protein PyrR/uracil phosphoribosyltransferase [Sulfuritalea hydrogenivorans sk43H]